MGGKGSLSWSLPLPPLSPAAVGGGWPYRLSTRKPRALSEFAANLATMLGGTSIAQAVPVLLSPILTRLFSPEQFALFGLYLSLAGPLGVVATGRYELAVMLPERDEDAMDLVWLALCTSAAVSALTAVAVWLLNDRLTALLGNPGISRWLYLLPVSVLLLGGSQVLGYWVNRRKRYPQLAASALGQQAATAATSLALGVSSAGPNGLILGTLAGQATATTILGWQFWGRDRGSRRPPGSARLRAGAKRYHQFPAFNMPYSLIGNFASGFGVIALSMFHHIQPAGFLNLARRVLFVPISFLSASLGQVFFQEAAVSFRSPRLERLTNQLLRMIAELGTPAFAFCVFWAPDLFAVAFGPQWRSAGLYAAAFSPVAFCFLFTSWPERIYEVAQRQHLALMIQVVSDSIGIALLWGLLRVGVAPLTAVLVYALAYTGYHATYLYVIYRIAGFGISGFFALGRKVATLGLGSALVVALLRASGMPPLPQFLAGLGALGLYGCWWKRYRLASWRGATP